MYWDIFGDLPHKRVDFWTRHLIHLSYLRNMRKIISPCISFERRGIQSIRSWLDGALVHGSICCHGAGRRLRARNYWPSWSKGSVPRKISVCDGCRRRYGIQQRAEMRIRFLTLRLDYQIFISDHPEDIYSMWGRILCRDYAGHTRLRRKAHRPRSCFCSR